MSVIALCVRNVRGAACLPRERSARRAARVAHVRLCSVLALFSLMASVLFPCGAFALTPNDQGVLWGPTSLGGGNSGIVVSATNSFDAALWAIGRWNTKIQLDNTMFSYLSNADTGGHFFELASYFHSYAEVGTPNWPNAAAVEGYAISFGPNNVWIASVPSGLIADARDDYNTVLNGGYLGDGSGESGDVPNYFEVTNVDYFGGRDLTKGFLVSRGHYEPSNVSWRLPVQGVIASRLMDFVTTYDKVLAVVWRNGSYVGPNAGAQQTKNISVRFYASNDISTSYASNVTVGIGKKFAADYSVSGDLVNGLNAPDSFSYESLTDLPNGEKFDVSNRIAYAYWFRGGQIGPPAPPPNNWPTDDPTPTPDPPEVPGPNDDPTPQPDPPDLPDPREYPVSDPYTPDPDPPANPIITYDPDPTGEPTDYRPWLDAILALLRKINTTISDGFGDLRGYLTEHCDHIREQIHSDSIDLGLHIQTAIENGFVSFERWLQGTFSGYFIDQLDYVIGQQFAELEDYLHSLFRWLASQFDFTFGGTSYDDSSVIYWLRRIYARLGGGAPSPGDDGTVDEGFDWWAWLLGLITDALGGVVTDLVGDIGGFLSAIAQKFPFSIPADIALYLSLLDAPRETPVFTFVIPAVQGWWDSWEIEIDLSPYDDAASIVRSMVLIWWGFVLVLRTDWLGGVFDDGARMVTGFFDKLTGGVANA